MKKATATRKKTRRPRHASGNGHRPPLYVLNLYVAGMTPRSISAIHSIKRICEEHLRRRYDLKVIDLCRYPSQARKADIVVAPTLVKALPLPLRRLIGDMADERTVLVGLNLQPHSP